MAATAPTQHPTPQARLQALAEQQATLLAAMLRVSEKLVAAVGELDSQQIADRLAQRQELIGRLHSLQAQIDAQQPTLVRLLDGCDAATRAAIDAASAKASQLHRQVMQLEPTIERSVRSVRDALSHELGQTRRGVRAVQAYQPPRPPISTNRYMDQQG